MTDPPTDAEIIDHFMGRAPDPRVDAMVDRLIDPPPERDACQLHVQVEEQPFDQPDRCVLIDDPVTGESVRVRVTGDIDDRTHAFLNELVAAAHRRHAELHPHDGKDGEQCERSS